MNTKEDNKTKSSTDWKTALKSLSVEPAGFFVILSIIVSSLIFQNLAMETICRVDLEYSEDICHEVIYKVNATYKKQEEEIQKHATGIMALISVILTFITISVILFIGTWSDSHGRKLPLLVSITGLMMFSLTVLMGYLLMGKLSIIQLYILAILPMNFCGGGVVFSMAAYSYISDTTSSKMRTVRTGILSSFLRSGTPVGFALGGILTRLGVGTVISCLIAFTLGLISFLIVLFRVENKTPIELHRQRGEEFNLVEKEQSNCQKYNPLLKLVQSFGILFKKRKNKGSFWLLIVLSICYSAPTVGEYSMLYMFVRQRLGWNLASFGFFSTYNWLMSAAGVILSMYILSKKLKLSDPIVGFVAGVSQISGSIMYAFTKAPPMMYFASAVDMMNGTIGVIVRSMLSKIVKPDEVGRLFGFLGVVESILPLIMVPTYAMVYIKTMSFFPGAFFLISAGVTLPAEIIFLYFMCREAPLADEESPEETAEMNPLDNNGKHAQSELERMTPADVYSSRGSMSNLHVAKY